MYTRDNELIINAETIEKYSNNKYFTQYLVISIIFSIALGMIVGLLVTDNKIFLGIVTGFVSIFVLAILWCVIKT